MKMTSNKHYQIRQRRLGIRASRHKQMRHHDTHTHTHSHMTTAHHASNTYCSCILHSLAADAFASSEKKKNRENATVAPRKQQKEEQSASLRVTTLRKRRPAAHSKRSNGSPARLSALPWQKGARGKGRGGEESGADTHTLSRPPTARNGRGRERAIVAFHKLIKDGRGREQEREDFSSSMERHAIQMPMLNSCTESTER